MPLLVILGSMKVAPRQLLTSLTLLVLLLIVLLPPLRPVLLENPLLQRTDAAATRLVEESLTRALAGFALARATNGVISVLQESEVAVSPAGIGLNLALGQVLDPLNDLVERFSWVMLVALTSLGIQRVLIELGPWLGFQVLGSLALLLWLAGLWLRPWLAHDLTRLGRRLLFLALVVRFAVPLAAGLNQLVYQHFLAERYAVASQEVTSGSNDLEQIHVGSANQEAGTWWQQLIPGRQGGQGIDFGAIKDWLKQRSTRLIDGFLDLLVVFLLNTVILPIAFLWGIFRLFRAVTGTPLLPRLERRVRARLRPESGAKDQDLPGGD